MMISRFLRTSTAILFLSVGAEAQQGGGQLDRDVIGRINAAIKQLDADADNDTLSDRELDDNRRHYTDAIRSEITRFVETRLLPSETSTAIEARLRALLAAQPDRESSDPATARLADLRYGRSLMVAYTVQRPPHFDTAMIYAFHDDGGQFRLAASTGEDFDGYTMFTRQVTTPDPKVMYVLAGGKQFTFNGAKFRFRLYAFDGGTFTTLWRPEDVFNAEVRVTPRGFAISYSERPTGDSVTANYETTLTGVVQIP